MKKRKIAKAALAVLSMLTIGAAGAAFAACDGDDDKHVHNYDKWILVTDPTLDTAGKAERYCKDNDGGKEETDVPKLTDTSVWTENLSVKVDPTCSATGKREFTSTDYGTVTVTLPVDSNVHSYGKWTLTKDPSKTETGVAVRVCGANGDHTDTKNDVPVLTDKSVWTLDEEKSEDATHVKAGKEVYTSIYGEVEVEIPANAAAHTWGKWEFVGDAPTLEKGGKIKHVCTEDNGHFEEQDVPALSNKDFWAETVTTPANHQNTGVADFKNAEYKIEVKNVTIPKVAHTFGAWTITTQPTLTAKGVATRVCSEIEGDCAEDATATETKELPELGDAFWTKSHTNANYNSDSVDTYTNAEYSLEVKIVADDKKPAPYDNVQYYMMRCTLKDGGVIDIYSRDNVSGGSILNLVKNKGNAQMQPLQGEVAINSKNPDALTGEIEVVIKDGNGAITTYPAYYDEATKVIVMVSSTSDFYILTPYYIVKEIDVTVSDEDADEVVTEKVNANFANIDAKAAYLTVENKDIFAINYAYETGKNLGIFVNDGVVTFNVQFKDEKGVIADVSNLGKNKVFYVHDDADKKVAHYGKKHIGVDEEKKPVYAWTVCDGFEGVYQVSDVVDGADVCGFVNGAGLLFYGPDSDNLAMDAPAYYEIINNNTIGAILEIQVGAGEWQNIYYEFTMPSEAGGKVTAVAPKVNVTFNTKGTGTAENLTDISKNVPVDLPVLENDAKHFMGWFTDADCKNPVVLDKDGKYKPVASVELYAKWVNKRTLTLKTDANDAGTEITFGEGELLGKYLPELDVDEANWRSFVGWFVDIDGKQKVDADTVLPARDDLVIYGEWKALPVYYGEYSGAAGVNYDSEASIVIDKNGNVTGHTKWGNKVTDFKATVQSYISETQELIWQIEREDGSVQNYKSLFYASADHSTRVLLMNSSCYGDVDVMSTTYLVVAAGDEVNVPSDANIGINYNALGEVGIIGRTRIIKYSVGAEEKLLLIYGDKLYANVTLENAFGEAVAHADVLNSKTIVVKQGDEVVAKLGGTGANLGDSKGKVVALDAFFGVKSFNSVEYKIDGLGAIVTDTNKYVYEVIDEDKISVFELNEDDERVAHYVMTITDGAIVSFEREVAELTYDGQKMTIDTKILWELPTPPEKDGKVFAGWHKLSDLSDEVITSIIIDGDTEIYADWRNAVKVTFNANGGKFEGDAATKEANAPEGMPVAMDEKPTNDNANLIFRGWFTDADCTEGNEWVSGETVVSEAITVYAKWSTVPCLREYKTAYSSSISYWGGTSEISTLNDAGVALNITEIGKEFAVDCLPFSNCTKKEVEDYYNDSTTTYTYKVTVSYNDNTKEITFTTKRHAVEVSTGWGGGTTESDSTYVNYGIVDEATGIVVVNHGQNVKDFSGGVTFLFPSSYTFETGNNSSSWKIDGKAHFYYDYVNDGAAGSIFVKDSSVHFGAIAKDIEGNRIAAKDVAKSKYAAIYAADGTTLICKYGNDGSITKELDGAEGTYTCEGKDDLVIDGLGKFVWGDKVGTYAAKDGGGYDLLVKDGNDTVESYILTLEAGAYEAVENKITISYTTAHGEQANESVFVGVAHTLPTTLDAEGFIFRGWFDNEGFTGSAVASVTPNDTDTYAYFAKWDEAVVLTVVYGDDFGGTVKTKYGVGDTVTLEDPGYTNGKGFGGWFTDSEFTNAYTAGAISADTTIYCKWIDAVEVYGTYKGLYFGVSTSSYDQISNSSTARDFAVDIDGNVTGHYASGSKIDNVENGTFKAQDGSKFYYGNCDRESGLILINTTSGTDEAFGTNLFFAVKDATALSGSGYRWKSNKTGKITVVVTLTITKASGTSKLNVIVDESKKMYTGVRFMKNGTTEVDAKDCYYGDTLVVLGADNNELFSYKKISYRFEKNDGMANTYTGNGSITLDGYGSITAITDSTFGLADATGTYTAAADGAGYGFDVVINDENYEMTITGSTYTLVKPMFNVSFNLKGVTLTSDSAAVADQSVNKGKNFTLPTGLTSADYKFDGWYKEDTLENKVSSEFAVKEAVVLYAKWVAFVPVVFNYQDGGAHENGTLTSKKVAGDWLFESDLLKVDFEYNNQVFAGWYTDAACENAFSSVRLTDEGLTLYAKWAEKRTVTLVANNDGLENKSLSYKVGDTVPVPEGLPYTNGKLFVGWFTADDQEYTAQTITENFELHAKWEESAPYKIENGGSSASYYWVYDETTQTWSSNNGGAGKSSSLLTINAFADITVTFKYRASSESGSYDYFYTTVNGSNSGNKDSGFNNADATDDIDSKEFKEATIELKAGQVLVLQYVKDGSVDKGSDKAQVKDLVVNGDTIVSTDGKTPVKQSA